MTPEKRREIASKGGKAASEQGTGHRWTSGPDGTAAIAGRKGGSTPKRTKKGQEGKYDRYTARNAR